MTERENCELECGSVGGYCKCRAEEAQAGESSRASVHPPLSPLQGDYAEVLKPFLALMEKELHANAEKGGRKEWRSLSPAFVMLEIYYHAAKLQQAVKDDDLSGVKEYSADVANMAMMMADVCGALCD